MNRFVLFLATLLAVAAAAGSGIVGVRSETAQQSTQNSIAALQTRAIALERQAADLNRQLAALQTTPASEPPVPLFPVTSTHEEPSTPTLDERRQTPEGPVLTNAMRDVTLTLEPCTLATRTLRCTFTVTNHSPAEKKFVLAVGGSHSEFESDRGGANVFDDIGNDFLSSGGAVGNRSEPNCDRYQPCEVLKILTPGVKTSGWIRFDAVDPRMASIKLLRVKWSDGEAWVPMDFRNIAVTRIAN